MTEPIYRWFEQYSEPFPESAPSKPPATLEAFVYHYARPFLPLIIAGALLTGTVALIEVYLFSLVGNLVDWLNTANQQSFWQTYQVKIIALSILVLIFLPGLKAINELIMHQGLLGNFAMRTRWQTHRYLLRQSVTFFQNDFAGRVATKMMQTSLSVRDAIIKITEVFIYILVYFSGAVFIFAASDIRLTYPMLSWLILYILILYYFIPRLRKISMQQAETRSLVTGRAVDSYSNITTVKMFADASSEDDYAKGGMQLFLNNVYKQMRMSTNLSICLAIINALLLFSVAASSIWLWQQDAVTTGAIAFALGLVLRLNGMSQWIVWEIWSLFENIGVVEDGIDTIAQDISITDCSNATTLNVTQGKIEYQNISFNYGIEAGDKGVIRDLNLVIEGGQKVGIVGRSGVGKSTLVNLLLRFYELKQGQIKIDGENIHTVSQESLRRHIAVVNQDTSLLHRSVYENISYGHPNIGAEAVITAAKQAKAHEFIQNLHDYAGNTGYQAQVGERGVKLSGGQRQRIAIARVLLKNAPILILDEATSALDSEVEIAIQDSLYNLMKGKTVIAIAHRLSTIVAMDKLIIIDEGRIIQSGTHTQLLKEGGLYKALWTQQSGGFIAQEVTETQPVMT